MKQNSGSAVGSSFKSGPLVGRQFIWPSGAMPDRQSHQIAAMTDESEAPGFDRAAHAEPYLEWFEPPPAEKRTGTCAVLISGGGYYNCCDVQMLKDWRKRLVEEGVQCVSLVYRTPRPQGLPFWKSALEDGQRGLRLVRWQAAERGFDPERIVTISQSAGSHMAVALVTSSMTPAYAPVDEIDSVSCHVNAAIVSSLAYGLDDGSGIANTRQGDGADIAIDSLYHFDEKTASICFLHGGADIYSPLAATRIYRRLRAMGLPAEVHVYPDKPHGMYGFERGIEYLRQMGLLSPLAPEIPLMERYAADSARAVYEKTPVWPSGKMPCPQPGQCEPYIEWHIPATLSTRSIQIIWAGGAYNGNLPDDFEVAPARRYLNEKGMAVATVKYRTPRPAPPLAKHVTAWQDVQRAIRIVRQQAAGRGLDPNRIGIMGSSAGGHLALMAATSSRHQAYWPIDQLDSSVSCAVQWALCIYPAYTLSDGGSGENVADGGNAPGVRLAPEFSFDPDTPPMLFVHGDADDWPAIASVAVWEQLRRMGIQGELHTLATRGHCFNRNASPGTGSYTYLDRIWDFLSAKALL